MTRIRLALGCMMVVAGAAWLGTAGSGEDPTGWREVAPGVLRSPGLPAAHALVDGDACLLIDAPLSVDGIKDVAGKKVERVLLTHHHWDTAGGVGRFLKAGVPVQAAQKSAEWLTFDNVKKYWQDSVPLRNSRVNYQVVPVGFKDIDCSLADGQAIAWRGWSIQVLATPGHSRDHLSYLCKKGNDGPPILIAGDALHSAGKLWAPYTTDWNHWTDEGQKPAGASLRQLARRKPSIVLPAHGPPIAKDVEAALLQAAERIEEAGFLKSFERYSKDRLGNPPRYGFLAKEQVRTNGKLPFSQISPHLYLTGNTYLLVSNTKACLAVDPWGKQSAEQIVKLLADKQLGPLEVVTVSHAHFDHYDGIYELPMRDRYQVWTLDRVAMPIAEPFRLRAPFLDVRPVRVERRLKENEAVAWREYRFRILHLPGQTDFTMGVETTIDGKKCLFTADNFFHQDQFSGTGGWMGLNRSWPLPYSQSAQKVLDAAPDWVLAEHGGAFEFNADDFRRRVQWGQAASAAQDAVCPSGHHRRDWHPNRVALEPLLHKARPAATLDAVIKAQNPLDRPDKLTVKLLGRRLLNDQTWMLEVPARGQAELPIKLTLPEKLPKGRHIFVVQVTEGDEPDPADVFVAVDVE